MSDTAVTFPGARRPDRSRRLDADGVDLAVHEWGDEADPPLLLAHGGFDFAGTFDVFAPMLADGGWRVVSWDQRGHGDSAHTALYNWEADLVDAAAVLDDLGPEPLPFVGHSKGGSVLMQLIDALPHRASAHVNLDGIPGSRHMPDMQDHERTKLLASELTRWLDNRRAAADAVRKPGTPDELAERRARMNPRLTHEWLLYLVSIGAREDEDGWRWKIDPALRPGGFGPWRPEWSLMRLPSIGVPTLAMLGPIPEAMGWGTDPGDIEPYLPPGGRLEVFEDCGHFIHIEQPRAVADLVLEFLS